jgi:uroporphyrinogen decarboxylase
LMLERENYLRNARFEGPRWIPSAVVISGASWAEHGADMAEVVQRHPNVFPYYDTATLDAARYTPGPTYREGEVFTDAWGCVWQNSIGGLEGIVVGHPLADWARLAGYRAPDPLVEWDREPANWPAAAAQVAAQRARGELAAGGPPHGFLFDRLTYLRGFENLMLDMATGAPELPRLLEAVLEHNRTLVGQWLALGVDVVELADDLGTQVSSIISPAMFRRWLLPAYRELIETCHAAGRMVAFHSDGYILNLLDPFIAAGVDIINPQDLVNGIADLARAVKGRMCIRLDIDRQKIVPFGTRAEIRELIEEEVRVLGDPAGGLEFIAGIYPPTTPDRVDALACALEEFRTFWWGDRAPA